MLFRQLEYFVVLARQSWAERALLPGGAAVVHVR